MLKRICIISLILLFSTNIYSQILYRAGIHGGLIRSNQEFNYNDKDIEDNLNFRNNFNLGFHAVHRLNNYISIANEISFKKNGAHENMDVTGETGPEPIGKINNVHTLNYLAFPVLMRVTLCNSKLSPFISAGVSYNRFLSYDFSAEISGEYSNDTYEKEMDGSWRENIYDHFKKNMFSMVFEIGLTYPVANNLIGQINARYDRDINPSFDNNLLTIRNHLFAINVGLGMILRNN